MEFSATEKVRWKTKIPGDGNSSPIIWGNRYQTPMAWNPNKVQDLPLTKAFSRVNPWAIVLK